MTLVRFFREVLERREELEEEETIVAATPLLPAMARQSPSRGAGRPGVERPAGRLSSFEINK